MKNSFKILLAVFVLLLVGVFFFTKSLYTTQGGGLFKFNPRKAKILVIKGKGETLVLKRKGNVWRITNKGWHPVEESRLERAFQSILDFSGQDIVSRSADKQIIYEVNSDLGTTVLFSSDEKLKTNNGFIVGKISQDYMNSYIRKMGSPLTLKQKGYMQGQFSPDPASWEKHSVFNSSTRYSPIRVVMSNISFTSDVSQMEMEKKGGKGPWVVTRPERGSVNDQLVNEYLRDLKYLRLNNYLSPSNQDFGKADTLFRAPEGVVLVEYANGKKEKLLIGPGPAEDRVYGKIDGRKDIFEIDKSRLEKLFQNASGLTQGSGTGK